MIATGASAAPSRLEGTPALEADVCRSGARGCAKASFDSTQALSGMLPAEVRVSLPPMVTPHSPRFTE